MRTGATYIGTGWIRTSAMSNRFRPALPIELQCHIPPSKTVCSGLGQAFRGPVERYPLRLPHPYVRKIISSLGHNGQFSAGQRCKPPHKRCDLLALIVGLRRAAACLERPGVAPGRRILLRAYSRRRPLPVSGRLRIGPGKDAGGDTQAGGGEKGGDARYSYRFASLRRTIEM